VVLTDAADYLPRPQLFISRWRNRNFVLSNSMQWMDFLGGKSNKSPTVDVQPEDLAVIQYTTGTTTRSKGVMLSHRNLLANALQTRHWLPDAIEGRERFLSVVPIFHSYGLTTALNVPVSLGAAMILKPQFQVLDILKTIRNVQPTIFPGVPSMYMAINNFRGVRNYGIKSVKVCLSGSAPLPVEVQEAFEKLTRGRLVEGYGLTEASPVTHANPLNEKRKVGTIGVPLPSTEARVVNLAGRGKEVKQGQIGELAVRGPQVMLGYWKNPEATKEVLTEDGWLLTGDVAQMDAEGYFRIISRRADMWYPNRIKKEPAFPRDIEEVIYEIPQVKEVAVTAIAGRPFAFVIAGKEAPTPKAVIEYAKRRLPSHLVPRFVIFMEDFPRTFIGKVLRRELAKRYERRHRRYHYSKIVPFPATANYVHQGTAHLSS
jgi:long-chain acyl-CoA synthetase